LTICRTLTHCKSPRHESRSLHHTCRD
jgi:hypothetical protein